MLVMRKFATAAVLATVLAGIGAAQAADDPSAVLEYRKHVMGILAGSISAISQILDGKISYSQHVAGHAKALNAAAGMVLEMFPAGSVTPDSRAKPEIWTDWAKFEQYGKALQANSAKLVAAAEGGDMAAIGEAVEEVGDACGGCHKQFRVPQQ